MIVNNGRVVYDEEDCCRLCKKNLCFIISFLKTKRYNMNLIIKNCNEIKLEKQNLGNR